MSQVPGSGSQWSPGGGGYMTTGGPGMAIASKGLIVGVPVALTVVSLVGVGKFLKAGGVISAADAALVRLYQTGRIPVVGGSTYYPPGWIGPALTMMAGTVSTGFTPDSSSGGGGPGGIPNLHRSPNSIEENGKTLHEQGLDPMVWAGIIYAGVRELSKRRCPEGKRWSRRLRRCVDKKIFPPGFTTIPYVDRKG